MIAELKKNLSHLVQRLAEKCLAPWIGVREDIDGAILVEWELKDFQDPESIAEFVEIWFFHDCEGDQVIEIGRTKEQKVFFEDLASGFAAIVIRHRIPRALEKEPFAIQPVAHVTLQRNCANAKDGLVRVANPVVLEHKRTRKFVEVLIAEVPGPPQLGIVEV